MGGKYSIIAKNIEKPYWEYSDYNVPNAFVLFFKAIHCFGKYKLVEIRKHS